MILDKEIEITIGTRNKKYYSDLGYNVIFGEKITINIEHLLSWSSVKVNVKCNICNKETKIKYRAYSKNTKNNVEPYCCCPGCANKKRKETNLGKYGVEFVSQNENVNNKMKSALIKTWKDKSDTEKEFIIKKRENTCFENFGYRSPLQHPDIFKKQKIASFEIKKYKDTNLYTQGGYELCFIQLMDKFGFIEEVLPGKLYNYFLNGKSHVYHSDFLFRGLTIEIKSTKTYNNNGKDLELQLENDTKWQTVKDSGDKIIVLWSKKEIKNYVENLSQLFIEKQL